MKIRVDSKPMWHVSLQKWEMGTQAHMEKGNGKRQRGHSYWQDKREDLDQTFPSQLLKETNPADNWF